MSFTVRALGQNCFLFVMNGFSLCIDPYFTESIINLPGCENFHRLIPVIIEPEELEADMIFCTHDHIDHLDPETIKRAEKVSLFVGPTSCAEHFKLLGIDREKVLMLNRGGLFNTNGAVIRAVYADHTQDSVGIVLNCDGVTVYITGDSLYNDKLLSVKEFSPDVMIGCINGKLGNMNYKESAKLALNLGVRVSIPCHYGMFKDNTENPGK